MDPEFLKALSQMAEEELNPDNISNANQSVNYLEQLIANDPAYEHTFMPSYLKEQITSRIHQPDIQVGKSVRKFPKRLELFLYGCKVTAAIAASLLIMIMGSITQNNLPSMEIPEARPYQSKEADIDISGTIMKHLNKGSLEVTNWLQSVSNSLMDNNKTDK